MARRVVFAVALAVASLGACGDEPANRGDEAPDATIPDVSDVEEAGPDSAVGPGPAPGGTRVVFDVGSSLTGGAFWDLPYPSDHRLDSDGRPVLAGFPNPEDLLLVSGFIETGEERLGYPSVPVVYFRFDGPLSPRLLDDPPLPPSADAPLQIIDVEPNSPSFGARVPVVRQTLGVDGYAPAHLLAFAPLPGHVLAPGRTYAAVALRSLGDASGAPLGVPESLHGLLHGASSGAAEQQIAASLAPLIAALPELDIAAGDVAAATVFTTGDVVSDLFEITESVRERYAPAVADITLDAARGTTHERFCQFEGWVELPQFQQGTPPFPTPGEGLFIFDDAGALVEQGVERIPLTFTLPRAEMPPGGFPLVIYFHGSGGTREQVVDRGPIVEPGGPRLPGRGPSHVLSPHGFATAGPSLPINVERVPGALDISYINPSNLPSYRDNIRQGVVEQRLNIDALLTLRVPPELAAGCDGLALPAAETAFRFAEPVFLMGQSQGAIYANMVAALEPRAAAVAPTGGGGHWSHQILISEETPIAGLVAAVLNTPHEITWMHPAMHMMQTAWEPVETIVFAPRVARAPLPGHPMRDIYQPVGEGDTFYPPPIFDAMAAAYGTQLAGPLVWPSMGEVLASVGRGEAVSYPVRGNAAAASGDAATAVLTMWVGDGLDNPHGVFAQYDEIKHQYGCFFESAWRDGIATVPAPAALGTPCP